MPEEPVRLGALVARICEALAKSPAAVAARAWPEVCGRRIAAHSWVEAVDGDTLKVGCDSPVWASYLQLHARALISRLQEAGALAEGVTRMRFGTTGGAAPGGDPGRTPAAERQAGLDERDGRNHPTALGDPQMVRALKGALGGRGEDDAAKPGGRRR